MLRILMIVLSALTWVEPIFGINNCSIVPAPTETACCQRPRLLNNSAFRYCDRSHQFTDDPTNGCSEYECFFLENKFFVHDEFQKNLLVTYLSDVAESNVDTNNRDFDWKGLIEDSYDTCIKRVEESEQELRQAYLDSYGINPTECNAKFVATMSCIYYQIFINCPGGAWDHSIGCNDWKAYVTSCLENIENLPIISMDYMYV